MPVPDKASLILGALVLGAGCAVGQEADTTGGAQAWLCESDGTVVACDGAIPAAPTEMPLYTCASGSTDSGCPPPTAIDVALAGVAGLEDFLSRPWACLLTGMHQRSCTKDIVAPEWTHVGTGTTVPDSSSGDPDADPGDGTGTTDSPPAVLTDPAVPTECTAPAWAQYFCDHANYEYRTAGIDVSFPCDLFEAQPTDLTGGFFGSGGGDGVRFSGGSCVDGEMAMRQNVWQDAVNANCNALNMEILTWCQVAADYAPSVGACQATGTW